MSMSRCIVLALAVGMASEALYGAPVGFSAKVEGSVSYGDRVSISLCITNASSDTIVIPDDGILSAFAITVTDSAGQSIKRTALGRRALILAAMPKGKIRLIPPGTDYRVSVHLNLLYDMSLPDDYQVCVSTAYSISDAKVQQEKLPSTKLEAVQIKLPYWERHANQNDECAATEQPLQGSSEGSSETPDK